MGYNHVSKIGEFKMTDSFNLISNREDRELLMQAIRDIPIDLGLNHIKSKLIIKNLDKSDQHTIGWAGATIGNDESSDIKIDSIANADLTQEQSSTFECSIIYQFGKYWLVNSKRDPIKDLYLKLCDDEEDQGFQLRPGDIIKIGSVTMKVNRFNVGKAEDRGHRNKMMEDKSVII